MHVDLNMGLLWLRFQPKWIKTEYVTHPISYSAYCAVRGSIKYLCGVGSRKHIQSLHLRLIKYNYSPYGNIDIFITLHYHIYN